MLRSLNADGTTIVPTDEASPLVMWTETLDRDSDGHIDAVRLHFSEPVNIIDGNGGNPLPGLTVAGYGLQNVNYAATGVTELTYLLNERGDYDTRAYYFPRWILTISFPISFSLMAIEFSRFVFGKEIMHTGEAGIHE